jgi:hypothetical protein
LKIGGTCKSGHFENHDGFSSASPQAGRSRQISGKFQGTFSTYHSE